jgi:hypothetical protein
MAESVILKSPPAGKNVHGGDAEMSDGLYGYFPGYLPVLYGSNRLENDLLRLPEDAQLNLLRRGADSDEELRRQIDGLGRRE